MNRKKILYRMLVCLIIAGSFVVSAFVQASFLGPPAGSNPPTGGGLFSLDPQRNIGFGGGSATPTNTLDDGTAFERVFMVTATNNPGLGLQNVTSNKRFILTARNNGRLALLDDSANATRFYVDTNGDFVVGGTGSLRATNLLGNVQAAFVTSGVFGGGTGNFAFPSALGIGTNSIGGLPTNGLYVAGQVKIAGGSPGAGKVLTSDAVGLASWTTLVPVGTSGQTLRHDGTNWVANSVLFNNGTHVGIGTTGPKQALHVEGNAILIDVYGSGASDGKGLFFREDYTYGDAVPYNLGIALRDWSTSNVSSDGFLISAYDGIGFMTGSNTYSASNVRMFISTGGNVGIGTSTPAYKFVVDYTNNERAYIRGNSEYQLGLRHSSANMNTWLGQDSNGKFHVSASGGEQRLTVQQDGNVGIGKTNPTYKLDVVGGGRFTGPVLVGPPSQPLEAATKEYVDTLLSGGGGGGVAVNANRCDKDSACEMQSAVLPGTTSANITGVNELHAQKIFVQTIDPIYTIGGISYATYVSDTIGLKMEVYGKAILTPNMGHLTCDRSNVKCQMSNVYISILDFKNAKEGSDLWLFWQTIDEGEDMEDIIVNLTPNFDGNVWYKVNSKDQSITIFGKANEALEVSYHLVAPRHDAKKWPTKLENPGTKGTVIVPK